MFRVPSRFKLERGVLHVRTLGHTRLELIEDLWAVTVVETVIRDHEMGADSREVAGHGPGVQVVKVSHVADLQEVCAKAVEGDALGSSSKQNSTGGTQ